MNIMFEQQQQKRKNYEHVYQTTYIHNTHLYQTKKLL